MIPAVDDILDAKENAPDKAQSWLVKCEICMETIATLDPMKLTIPMKGEMFLSPDELHGIPAPFHPDVEWIDMKCPVCHWRPFLEQDSVLLADGGGLYCIKPIEEGGENHEEEGRMQTETERKEISNTKKQRRRRR